jgi:hypothetical protein
MSRDWRLYLGDMTLRVKRDIIDGHVGGYPEFIPGGLTCETLSWLS